MATAVIPFPNWGAGPRPAEMGQVPIMPSYNDLLPPLTWAALHNVRSRPYSDQFPSLPGEAETYRRVQNPVIDTVPQDIQLDTDNFSYWSFRYCHEALMGLRQGELIEQVHVYSLAVRLVAWSQRHPNARMGNFKDGPTAARPQRWWIAPSLPFAIVPLGFETASTRFEHGTPRGLNTVFDENDPEALSMPVNQPSIDAFKSATFTLHLVYLARGSGHFALMILHKPIPAPNTPQDQQEPWRCWYLDSSALNPIARGLRAQKSRLVLETFIRNAGISIPRNILYAGEDVLMTKQNDGYSCSLHVVANMFALIRYETIGWDRVPGWTRNDEREDANRARKMTSQMMKSLHDIMGLKIEFDDGREVLKNYQLSGELIPEGKKPSKQGAESKGPGDDNDASGEGSSGLGAPPAKRARLDGEASQLETEECKCARPGLELGIETEQVRGTPAAYLAPLGNARDLPPIKPARGPLADGNWQTQRTLTINKGQTGLETESIDPGQLIENWPDQIEEASFRPEMTDVPVLSAGDAVSDEEDPSPPEQQQHYVEPRRAQGRGAGQIRFREGRSEDTRVDDTRVDDAQVDDAQVDDNTTAPKPKAKKNTKKRKREVDELDPGNLLLKKLRSGKQ